MVVVEVRQTARMVAIKVRKRTFGRRYSWLRFGREYWACILAVEVRQRTLRVEGRSWTRRTGRTTRRTTRRRRRGGEEEEEDEAGGGN